jgi:hypothetical protein
MADLPPVNQVIGVEDGYTGEHRKRGGYKKIIIPFPCDGGIGVTTLQDWIVELIRLQRIIIIEWILTLVDELFEIWMVCGLFLLGEETGIDKQQRQCCQQ